MADQIKVNDAAWKALAPEHKAAINEIVTESFGNVNIVGDSSTAAVEAGFKFPGLGLNICKILCDLATAAGHAACKRLPPPAQPICNAGVDAGGALCKSKCH